MRFEVIYLLYMKLGISQTYLMRQYLLRGQESHINTTFTPDPPTLETHGF